MCDCDIEKILSERDALLIREYGVALDFAGFDTRNSVLDVATGSGRMLLQLLQRGCSVVSGDINSEALDKARQRLGELADKPTLVIMDAHNLEFDNSSFQSVTFANAIHEIDSPRDALDEIARVMTDDGKLLVIEFNSHGFDIMDHNHKLLGKEMHPRGEMTTEEIDSYLHFLFDDVKTRESSITHAWIASGKKQIKTL